MCQTASLCSNCSAINILWTLCFRTAHSTQEVTKTDSFNRNSWGNGSREGKMLSVKSYKLLQLLENTFVMNENTSSLLRGSLTRSRMDMCINKYRDISRRIHRCVTLWGIMLAHFSFHPLLSLPSLLLFVSHLSSPKKMPFTKRIVVYAGNVQPHAIHF